jgi:hypothetical protein
MKSSRKRKNYLISDTELDESNSEVYSEATPATKTRVVVAETKKCEAADTNILRYCDSA